MKAGNPWVRCSFSNVFSWCLFCFCFPRKVSALAFYYPWSGWLHARALVESSKKICKIQNFAQSIMEECNEICVPGRVYLYWNACWYLCVWVFVFAWGLPLESSHSICCWLGDAPPHYCWLQWYPAADVDAGADADAEIPFYCFLHPNIVTHV